MKLLTLSIFLVIYGNQIFGATNYKPVVDQLANQMKNIQKNQGILYETVKRYLAQVPSSDYGIRKESRIAATQTALNQNAGKSGIVACQNRFNEAVADILVVVKASVTQRLNNVLQSIVNMGAVLDNITRNLTSGALDGLVRQCDKDPKNCKLTGEYSTIVNNTANAITSMMNDMAQPPALIMDKNISDTIDRRLMTVTDCLSGL